VDITTAPTHAAVNVWLIDTLATRVQCPRMAGVGAAELIYKAFGALVRERRESLHMTQLQLSARIGLTRGSVANIEAGRQSVLLHQLLAIAVALQMTPADLLPDATDKTLPKEIDEMPESVLNALKTIKKSARTPAPSRR